MGQGSAGRSRQAAAALLAVLGAGAAPAAGDDAYAGAFAGQGWTEGRIVDVYGASNWGNPGWAVDYEDDGFAGGVLFGHRFDAGRIRLRVEADGAFGDLSTKTNRLDPSGLDETAHSELRWAASLRLGVDACLGPATFFVSAGPAAGGLRNSVVDVDRSGLDDPWRYDPDDSFESSDTAFGWAASVGVDVAVRDAWFLRLEAVRFDFGQAKHTLNHSANNRCGPGNARSPCAYTVDNTLSVLRFAVGRRFGH